MNLRGLIIPLAAMVVITVCLNTVSNGRVDALPIVSENPSSHTPNGPDPASEGEDAFIPGQILAQDDRVGKITDVQGIVSVKPVMNRRWNPIYQSVILKPGVWVRTDVRGANAAAVRLTSQVELILGPGTLIEVVSSKEIKVISGELKIQANEQAPLKMVGPEQIITLQDTAIYRVDQASQEMTLLDTPPLWLQGFEGATDQDSIGSLVATIDGRNVPLTVGYHKVTVDIRDQIARTVIEESFQNQTSGRLEGVFYFPLPQDASISGFGMWIGNKLVEADVVEKQRAREIYETILRERRDPGLLEWAGGNLFKARVFPIEPHSEKRIKITYTQVLPLKQNSYRYSYALQSDMLKLHPLRELSIDVTVNSVSPLASVSSPTHASRIDVTEHAAHLEFNAQEYTPDRDFEAVIELAGHQKETVLIPHRRGDDGYFMLQLTSPIMEDAVSPNTQAQESPVEVLVLADTSGSMDVESRQHQTELLSSLLGSLLPEDRFNVATCDVACDWVFDLSMPASEKNVAAAIDTIAERVSLGWSDLDKAFESVLARSQKNNHKTHIIYVGDGVVNTVSADPVAFINRLQRLFSDSSATVHAVSVSSRFESMVLNAMASLGGGSMHHISGEQVPAKVAAELLQTITQPALHDLVVNFKGVRVARVYPERLANLTPGSQQILIGRYLPEDKTQHGEVIVTGQYGDQEVTFQNTISIQDAQQGNSFIPRLWARMHLDTLLQQGSSETIKDEIIGLSEEYNIITPYTSLLVLESDEDRERFKVKTRFRMRDGEKFFAAGRDNAEFALTQKQMQLAGNWRMNLRGQVLQALAKLGRDSGAWNQASPYATQQIRGGGRGGMGGMGAGPSEMFYATNSPAIMRDDTIELIGGASGGFGGRGRKAAEGFAQTFNGDIAMDMAEKPRMQFEMQKQLDAVPSSARVLSSEYRLEYNQAFDKVRENIRPARTSNYLGETSQPVPPSNQGNWITNSFPRLASVPTEPKTNRDTPWTTEALQLSERLERSGQLANLAGGLRIKSHIESYDVRWDELTGRSDTNWLVSPTAWLTQSDGNGRESLVQWCNEQQRGVYSSDRQLGRVRKAQPMDLKHPPISLNGGVINPLAQQYRTYVPECQKQSDSRTLLILRHSSSTNTHEIHVLIDTERHVVLWIESRTNDEVTSTTGFGEFVLVLDSWWATRVELFDKDGKRQSVTTYEFTQLDKPTFENNLQKELAGLESVLLIQEPLPSVRNAKQAVADQNAAVEDHFTLAIHFAGTQNWDHVDTELTQIEEKATGKSGLRWVRYEVLRQSRQREPLKKRFLDEAGQLAESQTPNYFLAQHLLGQANGFLETNEILDLMDNLRPVYENQPAHMKAEKTWTQKRIDYLNRANKRDEALVLQHEMALQYPHECEPQRQYAQALSQSGDFPAAYAWLDRVIVPEARWTSYEEYRLRSTYTNLLERQGRYMDSVVYLKTWVAENPAEQSVYAQYLSALIKTDQEDKANELIKNWLKQARTKDQLLSSDTARLNAAVELMLGQGYGLYTNRIEEHWLDVLADTAIFYSIHPIHSNLTSRIMTQWQFRQTDACRTVRSAILNTLMDQSETLPVDTVVSMVNWVLPNDPKVETSQWQSLAKQLTDRMNLEVKPEFKHVLSEAVARLYASFLPIEEYLTFLRHRLSTGPEPYQAGYAGHLFNVLLEQPWSAVYEDEAFALLSQLSDAEKASERLYTQVAALYRLTDSMLQKRYDARMADLEHPETLTRSELSDKQRQMSQLSREGYADKLESMTVSCPESLKPWLQIEKLYVDVLLKRNLDQVADTCLQALRADVEPIDPEADQAGSNLQTVLQDRAVTTLINLAARQQVEPNLIDQVNHYLDSKLAKTDSDEEQSRWRHFKVTLYLALDRPQALEQILRTWISPEKADNTWRRMLAYLAAEQSRIQEGITLLEAIETNDELSAEDYRSLAGWYMAVDARDKHERALIDAFKTTDEWQLRNWLRQKLSPWQQRNGALPSELDQDVLRVFAALFEKSPNPQNHLNQLREFYQVSRDFRLLAGLADAVIGHTAAKVYPFLGSMTSVLNEITDEATADTLIEHLNQIRQQGQTPIDHRALDLLDLLVERRSSEVLDQPGAHADRALAALKRAFKGHDTGDWRAGESRLMADFLSQLGRMSQASLADEQVRQLKALSDQTPVNTIDGLHIAHALARTQWSYDHQTAAVDLLTAALDAYRTACHGSLPQTANDALESLIAYHDSRGHYDQVETLLLHELTHPKNSQQGYWLKQRLYQLYDSAIDHEGDTSLGHGAELYQAVNRLIQKEMETPDQNYSRNLNDRLCQIYRTAHRKKISGVVDDLRTYGLTRLPDILSQQTNYVQSMIRNVAQTLRDLAGPRDSLELLIERIENEPRWFRLNQQDGWSQHGYQLARWRKDVGNQLGDLEPRLLKIVIAELKQNLSTQQSRSRNMFYRNQSHFWSEKADDFARAAEEVYAEKKQSGAAVKYIAEYLYSGLDKHQRAIAMLMTAHQEHEILDEAGQWQLARYLYEQKRHQESVGILEPLVKRYPDNMTYRVNLMYAYFKTDQQAKLLDLLKKTDAYFHEEGRWQENVIASLAHSCLQSHLFEQSVAYYEEVIAMHQRTQPGRGIGNGTLSEYYRRLSEAYSGQGKTIEAVDAACGAIVSWGPKHDRRADALAALENVLRQAEDLQDYCVYLEQQVTQQGVDNPIVRQALGKVYMDKKLYKQAIVHLTFAKQSQPNDQETHRRLITCYDQLNDQEGALNQLLDSIRLLPQDLELYKDLAERFTKLNQRDNAERARTSLIEALPNESEGHAMLAEIRQQQNRWSDAIAHWQQVADIRSLEPTGLLKLAAAYIHEQQWDQAEATCDKLRVRTWPNRFSSVKLETKILEGQIQEAQTH